MTEPVNVENGTGPRSWPTWLKLLALRPLVAVVIAVVAVGVIWAGGEEQTTPVTQREQRVSLSDQEQMQLGAEQYSKTLTEERANVVASGPQYEQVQRVAARITAVAAADKPAFDWEVTLIRNEQANAYCLPGGKIVVYTGILPLTNNDAGLATVLGHEVAHATAEHGAERLHRQQMTGTGAAILAGGVAFTPGQYAKVMALLGAGSEVGISLPWSRDNESEADHIGLIYMARAGYDPRAAVGFWERMDAASEQDPPEFASTHPSKDNRAAQIESWLPEALREYRAR